MPTETTAQPPSRLLIVGLLVPVSLAVVDHFLIHGLVRDLFNSTRTAVTMAIFIVQIGLLGTLCGRFLDGQMRWFVYGWGWALLDGLLVWALIELSAIHSRYTPGHDGFLIVTGLLGAQVSLLAIWAILGTSPWRIRWPLAAAAGTLLSAPLLYSDPWFSRFGIQIIALSALCTALWLRGYRLQPALDTTPADGRPGHQQRNIQFGIRHVLVWTTSLAVALGILRALDLLSWWALRSFFRTDIVSTCTAGIVLATVFIVAMWAALGAGAWWLRWPALLLFVGGGALITTYLEFLPVSGWMKWRQFLDSNWWIAAWICLAGGLLFAGLLFYREVGYRLVRRHKASASNANLLQLPNP